MKYLLLIYDEEKNFEKMTEAEIGKMVSDYGQFTQGIQASGHFQAAARLQPTAAATSVRIRDGKRVVTDGPFAETREQLGGYYLVDARDLDEAMSIAERIPGAKYGTVEIRPVLEIKGLPQQ